MDRSELVKTIEKYSHLTGYHAEQWNRFIIESKSHDDASVIAAALGWWLHCWTWKESIKDDIVIYDTSGI